MDFREQIQTSLGASYTIDRELGGGGMSRVFVARDATLRRDVVVKVLPPELFAGVNVERFRREILVAAGLQHPHIVPVLASGEMDGVPWFTMPFVQGESLRQRLARGPLPINEAVNVLREIAKALAYAHERGVVHRDIKPDNVLLTGGTAVVTDFGIAKALSASRTGETPSDTATRASLTQVGMSIGTPMYMAPEQAAADPNTDARADLYSFGCLAYELLAGRPPFVGLPPQRLLAAHMAERPNDVADLRRDTPPLLAELVMRCLEKDPSQRPATASDIVRVLESVSTTSGSADAKAAVMLRGRVPLRFALAAWAGVFFASWILAKAAIVGIGLPSWVLPGALIVAGLGLPVILFTAYVQREAHRALTRTPTLTPGGTAAPQGTMATIAMRASPHVSWRRTVRGGVLAFSAFVLLVAAFMVMRAMGIGPAGSLLASGRMSAKEPLLVADFTVRKGDSTLAAPVSEALRASLAQSNAVTLVSPASVASALQRMQQQPGTRVDLTLARTLAQREGFKAIVDGDVTQLGTGYVVTVKLISADSGTTLATFQKTVDGPKELIAAADVIGRELRGKIGESMRSVQSAPPLDQVTTPSIEALRLYSEGARAYDADNDHTTAIAKLSQAVAIDSSFAMAWRKLGSVLNAAGYPPQASDSALRKAYQFRDRLTPHERLATEGSYFFSGPGLDRERAAVAYQRMLDEGDSLIAANNMGLIQNSRRKFALAESLFSASIRASPRALPYINLLVVQTNQRAWDREAATYADVLRRYPSPVTRANFVGTHAFALSAAGHFAEGERLIDSLAQFAKDNPASLARAVRAAFAALHGQYSQIAPRLAALRAGDASLNFPGSTLQDSARMSLVDATAFDKPDRAVKRLDASLAATPLSSIPVANREYEMIAAAYARAGRPDRARAILAQKEQDVRDSARIRYLVPITHRMLGEIAIAENDPKRAIDEFRKGDAFPDGTANECAACTDFNIAHAFDKAGMADSAIAHYESFFNDGYYARLMDIDYAGRAPAARRLGELYEAKGDKAKALQYYEHFVDLWKTADPELQPQVADVKKRIARLGASRG